jgi:hypothetical protein
VDAVTADDRASARELHRAVTAARLFARMLTLEVAAATLASACGGEDEDEGEDEDGRDGDEPEDD